MTIDKLIPVEYIGVQEDEFGVPIYQLVNEPSGTTKVYNERIHEVKSGVPQFLQDCVYYNKYAGGYK